MSNGWRKLKIEETCRIRRGASPRPIHAYITESGIPWVKISDATASNSRFINGTKEFIKMEGREKSRFIEKGTLILSNSATPGIPKIMGIDACVHDGWLIIDEYNNVDQSFFYYTFINEREKLVNLSNGSVFRNLKTDIVKNYEINLPPLDEQKSIAHIFSTLDDKIETNNQINKTLEKMAQTIFKHWFVDFEFPNEDGEPYKSSGGEMVESELGMIPKGWEVGKFENLVTVKYGKDHRKLEDGDIPVYGSGGVMRYANKSLYSSESVLIPRKGTLNNVIYINRPFWSVDTMFFTKMNYPDITKYIYFFIKDKDLLSMNSGSAVPSMTTHILNKLPIIVSPLTLIQRFNKLVEPIFSHMNLNDKQIKELSNLRDSLLPKLMSGEIRIPLEEGDIS